MSTAESNRICSTRRRRVRNVSRRLTVFVSILTFASSPFGSLSADTVEVSGGASVDGKILSEGDDGRRPVVIEVDNDLKVAVPRSRVRKTVHDSDEDLLWYQTERAKLPENADAHYEFARQCKGRRLHLQCDYHFRRAIEIDPNHSKARAGLDYVRDGNTWIRFEDQQRQRGLMMTSKGWQVPEVYMKLEAQDEARSEIKRLTTQLTKLRTAVLRNNKRSAEALEEIKSINDPLAAHAFAEALKETRGNTNESPSLRRLYLDKLASFKTTPAVAALVECGMFEPDSAIRGEALHHLQSYGAPSAVATYLNVVRNSKTKPAEVTMALRGLTYFPDPELWEDYVEALNTQYRTIIAPGPGMQVGRDSSGGMGMNMGSKPQEKIDNQQNPDALALLKEIAPEADFRYDEARWRLYFAEKLMGQVSDLRRDP
ncbi:HEAT repeat domain-containing protein [Stieleria sp. JC731]|uniref:HEAT repeat domain-containing protein n=1 Tax=Pirellulaceae TaxID=2691357 RepID=UPI001E2FF347|nr:HEAT repeat domain-containing protein [Stieleria sp. JC731]MCC9603166.1 HEAT repeat domain-containing protein [Stieleria sp. JC731]